MTIGELKAGLSAWEPERARMKELTALIDLLSRHEDMSVAAFCNGAEQGLAVQEQVETPRPAPSEAADAFLVAHHLDQLRAASASRPAFMTALSELKADKRVRMKDISAIAFALMRTDDRHKTRMAAFEALAAWGNRKFDTERRLRETSGIF
jgi:hypothetical protein